MPRGCGEIGRHSSLRGCRQKWYRSSSLLIPTRFFKYGYARLVELVDTLDSESRIHLGSKSSSLLSRTRFCSNVFASVAELVDAPDLGSGVARRESSSLSVRTRCCCKILRKGRITVLQQIANLPTPKKVVGVRVPVLPPAFCSKICHE